MLPSESIKLAETLDVMWAAIDPLKRTFRGALTSAFERAASRNWSNDEASIWDFRAMMVLTPILSKAYESRDSRISDTLSLTGKIYAQDAGYKGQSVEEVKASPSMQACAGCVELLVLAILVAGAVAVYYFVFANAKEVIEYKLALDKCAQELAARHAEAQKLFASHLDREAQAGDKQLPFSDAEKQAYADLQKQQQDVVSGLCPKKPGEGDFWTTPWPYLGISVIALGVLGYVYRDELGKTVRRLLP